MTRRVSIAMATYNGAAYIGEQLDSFAVQTRLPDELVVSDDGSTDDTIELVREFARTAPFEVRIDAHGSRLGYTKNFERALAASTGKIIFISDQDDSWFPEKIARSLQAFESDPLVLCVTNDLVVQDERGRSGATILQNVRRLGYDDSYHSSGCATAVDRRFLEIMFPFRREISYDAWINRMAHWLGARRLIEEPLQMYRRHSTNVSESVLARRSMSKLDLLLRYGLKDPREGWEQHAAELREFAARIRAREADFTALLGEQRIAAALHHLSRLASAYEERLEVLRMPRSRRAPSMLRLWRRGVYRHFSGAKSALKDLIRP